MKPTIITYTGDGKTKTFDFGFSFFQPNDIVVETNGAPTTARYALQTARPNPTADMPYTGGAVCFADAPAAGVEIKIYREFIMTRPGDFQPTAEIEAHHLNREFNFNLENMRDFRDRQHATNATVKEHDNKIAQIIKQILLEDDTHPTTPDTPNVPSVDLTEIEADIAQIKTNLNTITGQLSGFATTAQMIAAQGDIASLDTRVDGVEDDIAAITPRVPATPISTDNFVTKDSTIPQSDIDYVVASQMPSAANNYTWYRKYKSGWVEQGGQSNIQEVTMPIEMIDTNYDIQLTGICSTSANNVFVHGCRDKTTTKFMTQCNCLNGSGNSSSSNTSPKSWYVCGIHK